MVFVREHSMPDCHIPTELVRFKYPLPHLGAQLAGPDPVKIVAIGSSSTAGREDVLPYPCRLELDIRKKFVGRLIGVLNKGLGGQEAPDELNRFDRDVIAEAPSLVIWQVGTNAIFHGTPDPVDVADAIATGLKRLKKLPMDVVLMDSQYTPAVLLDDKVDAIARMASLVAAVAEDANVNVFKRFALMRHWTVYDHIGLDQMIDLTDPDRLHLNDWSTDCVTKALCGAILEAAAMKAAT
jgi:hypothetical protein